VVLVAPDSSVRPHLPAWLSCHITVVPHALCDFDSEEAPTRQDSETLTSTFCEPNDALQHRSHPDWFTDTQVLDAHSGRAHLASAPLGAADCLQLLERGTTSCDLIASANGVAADVAESDGLRSFAFADTAEARRRAVLLLLLTYDPMLGAHQACEYNKHVAARPEPDACCGLSRTCR
jgi:hypothetical protein